MNDSRGGRCFKSPLKLERGHIETSNFVNTVHNYLENQEMSRILKYFIVFLCQLMGHDASNILVRKDFNLKFGYKNGLLEDSEALCMCPRSFVVFF